MLKNYERFKHYTLTYFKYLGLMVAFIYVFGNLLLKILMKLISQKVFSIIDKIPIILSTRYGVIVCTFTDLDTLWEIFVAFTYRYKNKKGISLAIDCGAHIGSFTLYVKKYSPRAKIIAVEPHPFSIRLLRYNVVLNKLRDVVLVPIALSSKPKIVKLFFGYGWRGAASTELKFVRRIAKYDLKYRRVLALNLDALLELLKRLKYLQEDVEIDLIKIDTEGSEIEIIRGGLNVLRKTKQVVIAAYHLENEAEKIKTLLEELNFKTYLYYPHRVGTHIYAIKQ